VHGCTCPWMHARSVKSMIYEYYREIFLLKCRKKRFRYGLRDLGPGLRFYVMRKTNPERDLEVYDLNRF
jgi:hypothetical protein